VSTGRATGLLWGAGTSRALEGVRDR
jgi:hypothetical protein